MLTRFKDCRVRKLGLDVVFYRSDYVSDTWSYSVASIADVVAIGMAGAVTRRHGRHEKKISRGGRHEKSSNSIDRPHLVGLEKGVAVLGL